MTTESRFVLAPLRADEKMISDGHAQMPVQTHFWRNYEGGYHVDVICPGDERYVSPVGVYAAMLSAIPQPIRELEEARSAVIEAAKEYFRRGNNARLRAAISRLTAAEREAQQALK